MESLRELRLIAGKAQAEVAAALKVKQPSVSKIEKQADMYLSTLRSYVEAIGGELELVVKLPRHRLRLHRLGDALRSPAQPPIRSAQYFAVKNSARLPGQMTLRSRKSAISAAP